MSYFLFVCLFFFMFVLNFYVASTFFNIKQRQGLNVEKGLDVQHSVVHVKSSVGTYSVFLYCYQ